MSTRPRRQAGRGDHQRHARRALEEVHLEPQAALAQHVAVVGEEDDDRVLAARRVQHVEDLADLVVDVGDVGEIAAARAADHARR